MKSLLPDDWRERRDFPPRMPRFEVDGSRGNWMVYDWAYAKSLAFDLRKEADAAARFARAYVKRHGDIDFDSFPYEITQELHYDNPDDIEHFWSGEYPAESDEDEAEESAPGEFEWDSEKALRKWQQHARREGREVELPPTGHPNPLYWLWKRYNETQHDDISPIYVRRYAVQAYAWAIPTDRAIDDIAQYSPILEVGAGSGYWASLLADAGADIIATDPYPPSETFFPVEKLADRVAVQRYGAGRTLFIAWPPYDMPVAYDALRAYEAVGGHRVVYIGEGMWGCTADDAFHTALGVGGESDVEHHGWKFVEGFYLPQWSGIHDAVHVYER